MRSRRHLTTLRRFCTNGRIAGFKAYNLIAAIAPIPVARLARDKPMDLCRTITASVGTSVTSARQGVAAARGGKEKYFIYTLQKHQRRTR
ncbi:hypothetical protein [Xanthomonas cannabis]|uniref:hypothetical protein n=1 Tax=Xanthomonas cannabis TaxID=1885674 RepID=UPI000573FD36|nr:hypothetical protein [Xanthomonas cannabis]KHL58392.1 hypothetical protein OZ13_04680 [Xanthomonas cannabis pv. cannabis]